MNSRWRSYVPKDVSEDLSHSDTRVSIQLNGFELHFYNQTSTYKELEKKFGIFTGVFNHNEPSEEEKLSKDQTNSGSNTESSSNYLLGKNWRDLIPVVKVNNDFFLHNTCHFNLTVYFQNWSLFNWFWKFKLNLIKKGPLHHRTS